MKGESEIRELSWQGKLNSYVISKQIAYKILDAAKQRGVDLLVGAEILIREHPHKLTEEDAVDFYARWLLHPGYIRRGRQNYLRQNKGNRAISSEARSRFPDGWAPEGLIVCPNGCNEGYFEYGERGSDERIVVQCDKCLGNGFVRKDGSVILGR